MDSIFRHSFNYKNQTSKYQICCHIDSLSYLMVPYSQHRNVAWEWQVGGHGVLLSAGHFLHPAAVHRENCTQLLGSQCFLSLRGSGGEEISSCFFLCMYGRCGIKLPLLPQDAARSPPK